MQTHSIHVPSLRLTQMISSIVCCYWQTFKQTATIKRRSGELFRRKDLNRPNVVLSLCKMNNAKRSRKTYLTLPRFCVWREVGDTSTREKVSFNRVEQWMSQWCLHCNSYLMSTAFQVNRRQAHLVRSTVATYWMMVVSNKTLKAHALRPQLRDVFRGQVHCEYRRQNSWFRPLWNLLRLLFADQDPYTISSLDRYKILFIL